MSDERWNDDVAYVFSIQKTILKIFGLWPLETQTVFTKIRCGLSMMLMILMLPYPLMEFISSKQNTGVDSIESILFLVSITFGSIKSAGIFLNREKLSANVDAAIDDWLSADEKTRTIMKKYALKMRIITCTMLYSSAMCLSAYILNTVAINLKPTLFTDPVDADTNTTNWVFLIPSGSLGNLISDSYCALILVLQIFQSTILCFLLSIMDCFYFIVTLHLAGQLEMLTDKFRAFANEPDTTVANYRDRFVSLINRHNELTEFYQNLEDSFHFILLSQFVIATVLISLLGLRANICLSKSDYSEFLKSCLVLNYMLTESFIYTYGGDFLQNKSEGIFHALYATSWFTLPVALMRDLHFAMMRSSVPFRLTGSKFFYVNRETMVYMLKTAASYVSVLRIALKD